MKMSDCSISIIVPVYNAQEWLDHCLDSIASQDFESWQAILVDDGSMDGSGEICDRYASSDSRFIVVHKENAGVSAARNDALDMAAGEFIMFVDSDDALLPGALRLLHEAASDCDFVLGGHSVGLTPGSQSICPKHGRRYGKTDMELFFEDNLLHNCKMLDAPWAKLFRRSMIGTLRFCENISYAEDKLFVFSFLNVCRSASTVCAPVYGYNVRPGSLGSDMSSDRHLMQMRHFLPAYVPVVRKLQRKYQSSERVSMLYHEDVIGRYVCRLLNIFIVRRTALLTEDYIKWLYSLMNADSSLGVFSVRPAQAFNILLFKIGRPAFTVSVYKFLSSFPWRRK